MNLGGLGYGFFVLDMTLKSQATKTRKINKVDIITRTFVSQGQDHECEKTTHTMGKSIYNHLIGT